MDRANSHTKSYNIPRSFEAMNISIKYELRAWVTCDILSKPLAAPWVSEAILAQIGTFISKQTAKREAASRTSGTQGSITSPNLPNSK